MSGMKRRVQPAGSNSSVSQPTVQMYNPNQYSDLQASWQHHDLQPPTNENTWYNRQTPQPQPSYSQPPHSQQPPQQFNNWQQSYPTQVNSTPNYNQQFTPSTQAHHYYNNQPQHNSVYNYEAATNHVQDSQFSQQAEGDAWNWSWGDEDNSNLQNMQQNSTSKVINNVSGNPTSEESWSLSRGDTNVNVKANHSFTHLGTQNVENAPSAFAKINKLQDKTQWSLDSQLSQDSSDPLHTSESDKSHALSRSSTVSESPVSGFHHVENYATRDIDMDTSSSSNSLQHENREVISNFQNSLPVKNHTPPSILTPPGKTQPTDSSQHLTNASGSGTSNPYKRNTLFSKSHKADFYSNNYVNLETMPDNSEHPDSIPCINNQSNKVSPVHFKPENNEVAPINDRNQYLETGQLESMPTAISSRLVVGQQLQQNDEPPPGLSRMVLGQTETIEPPVGLHRMVPGESSSPETYQTVDVSVRSATIGADTSPPTIVNSSGAYNIRDTNADGANNLDDESSINSTINRRDLIDGQPQTDTIAKLTNSIRDLTVGENTTDTVVGSATVPDRITRGSSRQDTSDSEPEDDREKSIKENIDRRYQHDPHDQYERQKTRGRYSPSPERYRDKKYERRKYRNKRYDDDTDYYSDKEKDRRRDDRGDRGHEEYDRKYSSLKRDEKDRKRREHRNRDYGRDSRRNDYYSRYEDDFEDPHRSRPTSRSDSMHDSYRQDHDNRHRDRDRHRRHREREPFNPYMQGYPYDPYNPYYQQYQYYENLRRTNPQAYAELYRKYYQQANTGHQSYGNDDRASVHSGRSSANDELAKERYMHQSYYNQSALHYYREPQTHSISGHYGLDESRPFDQTDSSQYLEESTATSQRVTPAKFATPHIKASLLSGYLVKVFPHYPLDGQTATVEVSNLNEILSNDDCYKELVEYPGPLVKGITHKKTIIEYCENKIRNSLCSRDIIDVDSYILMWELLILLLRQNGMVVGTDIAELLMKDRKYQHQQNSRRNSVGSHSSSLVGEVPVSEISNIHTSENSASSASLLKEEVITNKFRNYLIYGSEKEALEWAMKHGLWGHALFLASKLDKRTYANVMTRFANGLSMNDPLQTLYQLLSGKVPSAVTYVADEKWGDWRPHLAMILSNTTQRPELDRKAIMTLGDTLLSRESLFAAHFCYLMVQIGFSRYGNPDAKLVLLGSNPAKPFMQFATNEAILMTEIYEYACSLNNESFVIPEFLPYKYLLATRLADYGLLEKSLAYLEKISLAVIQDPTLAHPSLVTQTCELADHLQYYDPIEEHESNWLNDLKAVERDFSLGLIKHESVENFLTENSEQDITAATLTEYEPQNNQEAWQPQYQQPWQSQPYTEQQPPIEYNQLQRNSISDGHNTEQFQDKQDYWSNRQPWNTEHTGNQQENIDHQTQNDYWNTTRTQDISSQPHVSMPNQTRRISTSLRNEEPKPIQENVAKPKQQPEKSSSNSGWFGGIFSKLSLRPKNQMKLPDDKNPTIIWDETKKRWVNKDAEGDEGIAELKPPPKITEMFPNKAVPMINPIQNEMQYHNNNHIPQTGDANVANMNLYNSTLTSQQNTVESTMNQPIANQPNMFKLQRGRNLKKSYVDVFNPGSKSTIGNAPTLPPPGDSYSSGANSFNYFVPTPINDPAAPTDFLTPAPLSHEGNSQLQ